jgi:ABC-type transport system, involved in lipoprotein release, permease component
MIGFRDAFHLSRTKHKYKRVLLVLSIIVSGLMFGLLTAAIMMVDGVSNSVRSFTDEAVSGEYLVGISSRIPDEFYDFGYSPTKERNADIQAFEKSYLKEEAKRYKKLGIDFDPASIPPALIPDPYGDPSIPEADRLGYNHLSPVLTAYNQKRQLELIKTYTNTFSNIKPVAESYGATKFYDVSDRYIDSSHLFYLPNGEEDLAMYQDTGSNYGDIRGIGKSGYIISDDILVKNFLLPENELRRANVDAIPVVVTDREARTLFGERLGLSEVPKDNIDQVAYMQEIGEKLNGITYDVCYRNSAAIEELRVAQNVSSDILKNQAKDDYVEPAIIYSLPSTACAPVTVKKDNRTPEQKTLDKKTIEEEKKLGIYVAPVSQLLTFQIVGVRLDRTNRGYDFTSIITDLLASSQYHEASIPRQQFESLPSYDRYKDILFSSDSLFYFSTNVVDQALVDAGLTSGIIVFPSAEQARDFLKKAPNVCTRYDFWECRDGYYADVASIDYLMIEETKDMLSTAFKVLLIVFAVVSMIIISFTVSRVIVGSRRETAIFRALGAKRRDIVSVYVLYSLSIAFEIVIFAGILGLAVDLFFQIAYAPQITAIAKTTYGIYQSSQQFMLFRAANPLLLAVVGCIILSCLLSTVFSLFFNVRRNPINDIRDE